MSQVVLLRIVAELRGAAIHNGVSNFRALKKSGHPLILTPEPTNPVDKNAIRVTDFVGAFVGYVSREHTLIVLNAIKDGVTVYARTFGLPNILIWGGDLTPEQIGIKYNGRA